VEVKLEKRYPVPVEAERAWRVLRDVRAVAGCMPGASITEQVDEKRYKGAVKVKVGPANAQFGGEIEVLGLDEPARRIQLLGKGADRGGSTASMNLTATIEPGASGSESVLVGAADVVVNGKFAQFGGRMMTQVSEMILGQFADNFRASASALPATGATAAAPGEVPQAAAEAGLGQGADTGTTRAPEPAPVQRAKEINALAILWHLVKGWIAGLFGRRR